MRSTKLTIWLGCLFIAFGCALQAQVIINEISYNPPESGNDSLEYIELFNAGFAAVNIGGWHFTGGIEDTLPNLELQSGEYFVTAINAGAMMNVFGIAVHQWSEGALNNSGEVIILVDDGVNVVDSVRYADADPWPAGADGMGPSLELIDAGLDNNDADNWQISGAGTGIIINGNEVSGTPGAENSGGGTGGPAVTVVAANFSFTPTHAVIELGETIRWVNNETEFHNVNGTQDAYPDNPESFTSGSPAPGFWQFDYMPNNVGLYNYQCDPHFSQGMTGTLSVYDPLSYTDFPLAHLRLTDGTNGSHIFDGVPTRVTGVVHGINFQPTGYSFYIIDENNVGINVFSFDPGGYTVTQGDLVRVSGVIDQFNGLLEIIPDDIEILATGQNLVEAEKIDAPSEEVEGSHVWLFPFSVDSIRATGTSGFNVFAKNEFDDAILIRIDADSGLDTTGLTQFSGVIGVRGIGTQFDNSFPFTAGYQILALQFDVLPGFPILRQDAIQMAPNPASDLLIFTSEMIMDHIEILALDGKVVLAKSIQSTESNLEVTSLQQGMYIVMIHTAEGVWASKLLLRNK